MPLGAAGLGWFRVRRRRLRKVVRHPISQNVLALGTVQGALIVVPLITLPYLARVLSQAEFGRVVFVQTFSFLVALLVEYGFALSGTRDVATRRDEPAALADTVAGVQGAKLLLSVLATILALPLLAVVPVFRESPDLLAYGLALGVLQGLFPIWFFLGIERSQSPALIQLTTRFLSLVLIVALVRDASDGELVLALYVLTTAAGTGLAMIVMMRRVTAVLPSRRTVADALRRGRTLFLGTGATSVYTGANAFLLGLIVPPAQVAIFASAEKVVRAGHRVLNLTISAVYPRVSLLLSRGHAERANRLSKISLLVFGGLALIGAGLLTAFAPLIIEVLFGPKFEEAVPLLRILALVLFVGVVGTAVSTQWLLPRGLDRQVTAVLVLAAVLNVVLLIAATELYGLHGAAWAVVLVELVVVAGNGLVLRRALADRKAPVGGPAS